MSPAAVSAAPPPHWPGPDWAKRLIERLAALRSAVRLLSSSRRLPRAPSHRNPQPKPAAVTTMIPAVLWGGSYCGDGISIPEDACRLTRPDGSVYLRSSLTDGAGRPVFMLRLGRRTLNLPRQSDLA